MILNHRLAILCFYLLNSSCSGTCEEDRVADFCKQQQDEHFAIRFSESGRWYIGIDDGNAEGGVYLLDAIKPAQCGDGKAEHGEACDGQEGCNANCTWTLNQSSLNEKGFNFNFDEANFVEVQPGGTFLEIQGAIGGFEGCAYPDVFEIDIPGDTRLVVEERIGSSGNECTGDGAGNLELTLRNAANVTRANQDVANGCSFIDREFVASEEGHYFLVVKDVRPDSSRAFSYRLRFTLTAFGT